MRRSRSSHRTAWRAPPHSRSLKRRTPLAALHYCFPSKEALLTAVYGEHLQTVRAFSGPPAENVGLGPAATRTTAVMDRLVPREQGLRPGRHRAVYVERAGESGPGATRVRHLRPLGRRVPSKRRSTGCLHYDRSAVGHWISGARPRDAVPYYIAEALTRLHRRTVSVTELGFGNTPSPPGKDYAHQAF
jgi:AcrR family transcriptional regulator